jgi:Post-segregation antitoxin CcdA
MSYHQSSATLEEALTAKVWTRQQEIWLAENQDAIAAYNEHVAKNGVFSDGRCTELLTAQLTVYRNRNPTSPSRYAPTLSRLTASPPPIRIAAFRAAGGQHRAARTADAVPGDRLDPLADVLQGLAVELQFFRLPLLHGAISLPGFLPWFQGS